MNQKTKTLIGLAAIATTAIHVINRIEYSHSTLKNILPSTENRYYEWRFGKIRYTKKGSGTPLLLLHDLTLGSSSYEFHKISDHLSKHHEVYTLDFLGYGLSDKPDMTYTNYLYVQMIADFIKNIIGRKTDIIATGDAFPVAVMACHNDTALIRKLTAINPPSLYQLNQIPSKQTKFLKLLLGTPVLGTFIYNMHSSKNALTKLFQEKYFCSPQKIDEKDIDSYVEAAHTPDFHSKYVYSSYISRYMNANILHPLKEIDNSICLIGGEKENDIHNIIENYVYYNNAIESCYIKKTRHLPHLERPEEILSCLEIYLS